MRPLFVVVSLFLMALGATGAQAHAHLDHASPAVGSTVPTAPQEITLWFTQNLEAAFSTVEVFDGSGGRVDEGKPNVSGNTMRVGAQAAGAGNLPGSLARALGRHTHDRGNLHLPGGCALRRDGLSGFALTRE